MKPVSKGKIALRNIFFITKSITHTGNKASWKEWTGRYSNARNKLDLKHRINLIGKANATYLNIKFTRACWYMVQMKTFLQLVIETTARNHNKHFKMKNDEFKKTSQSINAGYLIEVRKKVKCTPKSNPMELKTITASMFTWQN